MNLKKYEKKIEELEILSKRKLDERNNKMVHKRVFSSVMKEHFGMELNKDDIENIRLVKKYPDEYRFADVFHNMGRKQK